MGKFEQKYTSDMIAYLRDNSNMPYKELAEKFNKEFNQNNTANSICSVCKRYNIKHTADKKRKFKKKHIDWFNQNKDNYKSWRKFADAFNLTFGTDYTLNSISSTANFYGIHINSSYNFSPKEVEWLKNYVNAYKTYDILTDKFNELFKTDLPCYVIKYAIKKYRISTETNRKSIVCDGNVSQLKSIYDSNKTYKQITDELNQICNTTYSKYTVSSLCKKLFGNKPRVTTTLKYECLSDEEKEFVTRIANTTPLRDIQSILRYKYNKIHTEKTIRDFLKDKGLKCNNSGRFKHGHKMNTKAVGDIVYRESTGYYYIKVGESYGKGEDNYVPYHRYIYEEHYGKLSDNTCVVFLDGDITNFDINNLYAIPRRALGMMSRCGWWNNNAELTKAGLLCSELSTKINTFNKRGKQTTKGAI